MRMVEKFRLRWFRTKNQVYALQTGMYFGAGDMLRDKGYEDIVKASFSHKGFDKDRCERFVRWLHLQRPGSVAKSLVVRRDWHHSPPQALLAPIAVTCFQWAWFYVGSMPKYIFFAPALFV